MKLFRTRDLVLSQQLARRTFLKAIGIGIAAPLAFKMSKLAVAQSTARPTRLFIFFLPHGAPNEHWEVGADMALDANGVGILSPLDPYKKYLTVLRGVGNNVSTNHEAIPSVLSGVKLGAAPSVDYLVATALGTTPHVLGVKNFYPGSESLSSDAQLVNHGGFVTPIQNPYNALADLFDGLGAAAAPPTEVVDEKTFRTEAIDLSIGEIEAMQAAIGDLTTEKNKLQIHLDSLRNLKDSGGGIGVISCETRPSLPSAELLAGIADRDLTVAQFGTILDGHLEAAANAMLCGTARVITLQNMHANAQILMNFPGGPGFDMTHHDPLSHSSDATGRGNFAEVQKWFYSRLAEKFLAVLDQTDPADPEHTVLDNTTVLTCSEIADGQNHNSFVDEIWLTGSAQPSYLPWTIIGGGGGFFKGNQVADFGVVKGEGIDHRHILAAVAESMGVPLTTIGDLSVSSPAQVKA